MKKIIKTLLVVMVVVLALAAFTACQEVEQTTTTTTPAPEACTHSCVQEYIPGYDATCTEDGLRPGFKCPDCGEFTKEPVVVPAHHRWEEATCTAPKSCTECDATEGEALGHSFTIEVEAKDPTCLDGYTAHKECDRCGAKNEEYEVLPGDDENGHEFNEDELFYHPSEPTCTEGAYIAGYCVYCEKGFLLDEVAPLGHTWVGGDCTTPATCSVCEAEGELVHNVGEDGVCADCGIVFVETAEALIAALEAGKKVVLMNDIEMDATVGHPYGGKVGVVQRGGELNGNGYTLTVHGEYAILTYGGTIKNLTVDAAFRAIVLYAPTEDVILDNVTVYGDDIVYGFNTQEYPKLEDNIDIVVKNSTICGWVSFAGTYASVTFENCEFVQGVAYTDVIGRLVRPYVSTTFTNCTFINNAYLDLSALAEGETVTLVGCKVAGVDVTVDVFTTEENHAEIPFTYEAPEGVELVLTAVEGGVSFHRHGYVADVTAPTCTAAGKTVYTCACGHTYEEAGEAATGHADANGDYKCDACATKMLPADGEALTIEQALAIAKLAGTSYTTQKYYITGIVTNVYNTTYGNLYLKDAEGNELCIYGLYTWDKAIRYDKMDYKPVEGDELTVYTVLGMYGTTCQGKDAWVDEVVHNHNYADATCTVPATCSCGETQGEALGHNYVEGVCSRCNGVDPDYAGEVSAPTYVKVTDAADFTSGTYVIVVNGYIMTKYDSSGWVLVEKFTGSGDTIVSDSIATWTVTVNGSSVTLKDAKGTFIKPKAGNNNGIQTGSYNWAWTMTNGKVNFKGTGSDTTILAANVQSENKIRAYKTSTVSGNAGGYPSNFEVYKLVTE